MSVVPVVGEVMPQPVSADAVVAAASVPVTAAAAKARPAASLRSDLFTTVILSSVCAKR